MEAIMDTLGLDVPGTPPATPPVTPPASPPATEQPAPAPAPAQSPAPAPAPAPAAPSTPQQISTRKIIANKGLIRKARTTARPLTTAPATPGIGLYIRSVLTRKVLLPFTTIGANISEILTKALQRDYEGKCTLEGYIKKNSIRLINYSAGTIQTDKLVFHVLFECLISNPVEGFGFRVIVRNVTKAGIRATTDTEESPVVVFLAREHHVMREDSDIFAALKMDDEISVRVIGSRFELNDPYISVIAEFISLKSRPSDPEAAHAASRAQARLRPKLVDNTAVPSAPTAAPSAPTAAPTATPTPLTAIDDTPLETFRGDMVIIPRSKDWKLIDETDKYSREQRLKCKTETGKECTLYPFPAGMEVMRMFRPTRWLDPTAGWGDRLRVAIASGVEYVGVDSNPSMQSAYKAIIDDKADGDHEKYRVIEGKFQDAKIDGTFDLVFTSPPFLTVEVYENMVIWKDVEDFMEEFLRPLFRKSYQHLKKDGHIVLYIEDRPGAGFIDLMKGYVKSALPGLEYEGAFYYQGEKPRPYYVWVKRSD